MRNIKYICKWNNLVISRIFCCRVREGVKKATETRRGEWRVESNRMDEVYTRRHTKFAQYVIQSRRIRVHSRPFCLPEWEFQKELRIQRHLCASAPKRAAVLYIFCQRYTLLIVYPAYIYALLLPFCRCLKLSSTRACVSLPNRTACLHSTLFSKWTF